MKNLPKSIKLIFFDTDCLSTFLRIGAEFILFKMYNHIIIPRQVYNEISKYIDRYGKHILREKVDQLVRDKKIMVHDFIIDSSEETLMYYDLINESEMNLPVVGKGEAAAITLAHLKNGILASNNLKDVSYYVKLYKIEHITTAEILKRAQSIKIIDLKCAEELWEKICKNSKMPTKNFFEYATKS